MATPRNKIRRIKPRNSPFSPAKRKGLALSDSPLVQVSTPPQKKIGSNHKRNETSPAAASPSSTSFPSPLVQVSALTASRPSPSRRPKDTATKNQARSSGGRDASHSAGSSGSKNGKASQQKQKAARWKDKVMPTKRSAQPKETSISLKRGSQQQQKAASMKIESQPKAKPTPPKPLQQQSILSLSVFKNKGFFSTDEDSSVESRVDDGSATSNEREATRPTPPKASKRKATLSVSTLKKRKLPLNRQSPLVKSVVRTAKSTPPIKSTSGNLSQPLVQSVPGQSSYEMQFDKTSPSRKTIRGKVLKHACDIMKAEADKIFPKKNRYAVDRHKDKVTEQFKHVLRHDSLSTHYKRHKTSSSIQETNTTSKTLSKLKLQTDRLEELLEKEKSYYKSLLKEKGEYNVNELLQWSNRQKNAAASNPSSSKPTDDRRVVASDTLNSVLNMFEPQQKEKP